MTKNTIQTLNEEQLEKVCGGRVETYHRAIPEGSDMKKGARVYKSLADAADEGSKRGSKWDMHIVVRH